MVVARGAKIDELESAVTSAPLDTALADSSPRNDCNTSRSKTDGTCREDSARTRFATS